MEPRRGATRARLALTVVLAAALALVAAIAATPAQAGCPICDQYTLDIPDAQNNSGYGAEPEAPAPEPDPVPEPAPTAAPTTVPTDPAVPVEPVATTEVKDEEKKKPKPEPKPEPDPVPLYPVQIDGPPSDKYLTSTPLSYEGEDTASSAALAGLGSPGTIALLAALIAGGAAIALGRRRTDAG